MIGSASEIVEELIARAEKNGASDIHVQMVSKSANVFFRLDGLMTPVYELQDGIAERVLGRIKFLAKMKTYIESIPQDGRITKEDVRAQSDIRVATYPTVTGEKIVLRLFSQGQIKTLDQLNFPQDAKATLENFLRQTSGLLLLTGPSGSGKTTTIYACLQYLAQLGGHHIITVEDPVEQIISNIMQTEVNPDIGLTFAKAARHLLRQDPQVLVVGEIRDEETANIAVHATLTGHMVITTLHAGSCKGVFERMLAMCEDRYSVISSIAAIINQRLIRKVCKECKGQSCNICFGTGYQGRVPVVEWIRITDSMRSRIHEQGLDIIVPSMTLHQAARILVEQKVTNEAEYIRMFGYEL